MSGPDWRCKVTVQAFDRPESQRVFQFVCYDRECPASKNSGFCWVGIFWWGFVYRHNQEWAIEHRLGWMACWASGPNKASVDETEKKSEQDSLIGKSRSVLDQKVRISSVPPLPHPNLNPWMNWLTPTALSYVYCLKGKQNGMVISSSASLHTQI